MNSLMKNKSANTCNLISTEVDDMSANIIYEKTPWEKKHNEQ